ncbi:FAD-dependent oxidoreductase [Microbacterium sp. SS28]|uniref:FAD-dependent oxidoreductase n=1 Tax=Microbacterium sp. SS28 TaxID=2919948 RepID=UPI001FA9567F|nr:FAD-dependent oxidoreductase [Microbacterium sp. SS28]
MRIAIVGSGGAGLTAAWLLEQEHDVTLYEADDRLGGHAHTIDVEARGQRFGVDAGFQFFGPGRTYATFTRLLEALHVPVRSYRATISLTRTRERTQVALPPFRAGRPVWPSLRPSAVCDLIRFQKFLRGIPPFLAQHDTTVTIEQYIERAGVSRSFADRFLYPLLLAFWCVEPAQFRRFAAYNALFYLGEALTDGLRPPLQLEIEGGMRTYVDALAADLASADVRVGAGVQSIAREGDEFLVRDAAGGRRAFDQVVLATGARQALALVEPLPGMEPVARQLRRFEYFDTRIAIHGDRSLMPPSESVWSIVNARWDGTHSHLSIWNPERGLPVFRSWVTFDERMPQPLYATATYEHLAPTVEHFDAQRELKQLRGHGDVWLAGLYTDDADSHESAVRSAVTIAQRLAPDSPRLRKLMG